MDDDAEIVRELEPGGDVRVVIERRHHDLVALAQRAREGAAEEEVERGHALTEGRLARRAAEEPRRRLVRPVDELHGAALVSYGAPMFALSSRR